MAAPRAIRAFLGLELGAAARRRAAALAAELRRRPGGERVRWVDEEALHVTLRFLGATEPARIPELVQRVGAECRRLAPFALAVGTPHFFPSPRHPRVVALALEPTAPLGALAAAVERGVVAAGCPAEERPFRPHLTLGRVRQQQRLQLPAMTAPVTEARDAWKVVEIVLFQSETGRLGPRYTPLERMPLAAPGALSSDSPP